MFLGQEHSGTVYGHSLFTVADIFLLEIYIYIYIYTYIISKYMGCLYKCLRWFKVRDCLASRVWIFFNPPCILGGLKKIGQHFYLLDTHLKIKPTA